MVTVLLIEDDHQVRRGLELALGQYGYTVHGAATGADGIREFATVAADVVILDIMLPGVDGFEVCRRLRSDASVPIIMLTARDDDIDVVVGLEAGADDYVCKPVQPRVLDARIKAVLRRGPTAPAEARKDQPTDHAGLVIDPDSLVVTRDGTPVALTPTELRLLLELSAAPKRVFTRLQLLESVWGHQYLGDSRLVDNCVQRVRAKIENNPATPVFVQTVRGFGYRFGPV
ncbi:response regulator [Nocardia sp. NPDC049149]|uniref:response regulator n=1 Tax=Nocardia sp. NPDC049149 TaxID=3364315 RepID=UPI00371FE3FA